MYLPFFMIGHLVAIWSDYPIDGFSYPYQVAISWGSLLIAIIGLYFLRKNLKYFFEDTYVGTTLLLLVIGTNYLDYSAINGAMTHNYLFTLYAILITLTIRFHKKPTKTKGTAIGFIVGLMALTRPTEIIACLIPLLWNIPSLNLKSLVNRIQFFGKHYLTLLAAIIVSITVGSLQLLYWKYVSGNWLVYSYQEQGFSWLNPHFYNGFFSYKAGWLVYTPLMLFSIIGFIFLWKNNKNIFWPLLSFFLLFTYITFAWDIWWYGGSLGQRAMVQSYLVLAFPFTAFIQWIYKKKYLRWLFIGLAILFSYYNIWLTYHAHIGGLLKTDGSMTKAYFWAILGKYNVPTNTLKLLDTDEVFTGIRKNKKLIYKNTFELDTLVYDCNLPPIDGNQSFCLKTDMEYTPAYTVPLHNNDAEWVRVSADVRIDQKEWNKWKMTQLIIKFKNKKHIVKERKIRVQRLINNGEIKHIYIDSQLPKNTFNHLEVLFLEW